MYYSIILTKTLNGYSKGLNSGRQKHNVFFKDFPVINHVGIAEEICCSEQVMCSIFSNIEIQYNKKIGLQIWSFLRPGINY